MVACIRPRPSLRRYAALPVVAVDGGGSYFVSTRISIFDGTEELD